MNSIPERIAAYIDQAVWSGRLDGMAPGRAHLIRLLRLILVLGRDLAYGQLTLRAMGLVYTTLLSIVPLLALSFSVLKAFGVHNQIEPMLEGIFAPLGAQAAEVTTRIIHFIDNLNVGVLGSVGLALLLYTAVSLVHKMEESFNFIWHVSRPRSLSQRFSNYLSVLFVAPILGFSALGITAAVASIGAVRDLLAIESVGRLAYEAGQLTPYFLVIVGFTFVYVFIPNTTVRVSAALVGGIVGGLLWQSAGWAFAAFVASSSQYAAIYSSFAVLVLFLIWLYVSWLILLFGASVAFYQQHPEYLVPRAGNPRLSNRMRECVALLAAGRIAEHHLLGRRPWTLQQLAHALQVPTHAVETVLVALRQGGILAETSDDPPAYLPARDMQSISIANLLDAVRAAGEERYIGPNDVPVPEPVARVLQKLKAALDDSFANLDMKALATQTHATESQPPDCGQPPSPEP